MKPEQLSLVRQLGAPAPHPQGAWAAVAITRPDLDADAYVSSLWRLDVGTGDLTTLTTGESDSAPEISGDGAWLAFTRTVDGTAQLAVAAVDESGLRSEPRVLTNHPLGVRGPFAFDGARIAYAAQVPEAGRYGTDEKVGPGAEPPRHITDFTYRVDGTGFLLDRPSHLFTLTIPQTGPEADPTNAEAEAPAREGVPTAPVQVTSGEESYSAPTWFEGDLLASRGNRNALHTTLVRVTPATDGAATNGAGTAGAATVDEIEFPHLVTAGASGTWHSGTVAVDAGDRGKLWLLVADFGEDRMDFIGRTLALASARLEGATLSGFVVHTDSRTDQLLPGLLEVTEAGVYVMRERRGTTELLHYDGELNAVISGDVVVTGGGALPGGGMLVATERVTSPGEIVRVDSGGGERTLTNLAARLQSEAGVYDPVDTVIEGPDGYPVHGWVTVPDGPGPHPVLLLIHGGPHAAYTPTYFDEVQVYTAAGYAVVFCNPRGSSSYGQDHGRAITGGWGKLDAQDVLAFLDGVLATRPDLDSERVGILGGSYGGYMTGWLTILDHRWAGAIVERGFLDAFSFEGSSDIGWYFGLGYMGQDPELVAAQNPMSHIDKVRTPTLVIHSEQDWRCPLEQGQRWFVGLKRRGVDAEFLLFSGEGHELSRSGTPKHRLARFEHILAWWDKYLPV